MKDNLFKKFLSFSYGSFIGLIIGFITTIITTRILTPENFGKASMFTLVLNVSMILIIFGTDQTFVRFFYEEKESKRGGLFYNCIKISFFINLFLLTVILLFQKPIMIFLFGEYDRSLLVFLIIGVVFQTIYRFAILVIRMQKKGNLYSIMEILNRLIQIVIILVMIHSMRINYNIIIYSTIFAFIISSVVAVIVEKKYWSINNFFKRDLRHSKIQIFKYSYPLVFQSVIFWLFESFDRIALRHWSSFYEIGLFAAASKIIALLNVIQVAFTTFWTPVCFENYEKSPNNTILYEDTSNVVSFVMFTIAILTIIFKKIIMMVLGSKYAMASTIIPFLVFMPILFTLSETTVIGINFFKKTNWHIVIALFSCATNIIGNWILVPLFGALGAAISTSLAYIVFFSLRTFISLKYYKVKYGLFKIYTMLILIFLYGFFSIKIDNGFCGLLFGGLLFLINVLMYFNVIKSIIQISNFKKLFLKI